MAYRTDLYPNRNPNRSPAKRVRFGKGRRAQRMCSFRGSYANRGNGTEQSSSDVVPVAGVDLRCGAGHLGLQGTPGALPSALGFDPRWINSKRPTLTGGPCVFGAGGGGRTRTSLRTRDFESRASANSTTPAFCVGIIPRLSPLCKSFFSRKDVTDNINFISIRRKTEGKGGESRIF